MTAKSGRTGEEILAAQIAELEIEIKKCKQKNLEFLIMGDFNVDFKKPSSKRDLLVDLLTDYDLKLDDYIHKQEVQMTFRGYMGNSWIDHCATLKNNNSILKCSIVVHKENTSDHLPLAIDYALKSGDNQEVWKHKALRKQVQIDYRNNEFLKEYETRIEPILDECNKLLDGIENLDGDEKNEKETMLNEVYNILSKGLVDSAVKSHNFVVNAPKNKKRSRNRRKLNKWWDQDLKVLHLKQCHAYNLYALTDFKGETEKVSYHSARKNFKDSKNFKKKLKQSKLFRFVNNLFHLDRISFWRQIKRLEMQANNINIEVEALKCEYDKIFNETYCSKEYESEKQKEINDFVKLNEKEIFRHKTEHFVIEGLISELKGGKAIGLRGVSNEMVKNCPSSRFVPTLARFFDCMINEQVLPIGFNVSILKPILKSVNKPNDDISNTRPVAISDAIQNLYERLLLWEINGVHKEHPQQFGFKSNSSCSHAIFVVTQLANFTKKQGKRLYTCAVDASKAFDKVCRPILWLKLIKLLHNSIALAVIHYYDESYMLVQLDDKFSNLFRTTNGVRQGGVMSPKLFAIYVDDLIRDLEASGLGVKVGNMRICAAMYADDLLLMSETKENVNDLLKIAESYGISHGMRFNPDKTELLVFNHNIKRSTVAQSR